MEFKHYENELRDLLIRMGKEGIKVRLGMDKEVDEIIECLCLDITEEGEKIMYLW